LILKLAGGALAQRWPGLLRTLVACGIGTACCAVLLAQPAGSTRPAVAMKAAVRIVALGDSTTASYSDWAPQVGRVYADCLAQSLGARAIAVQIFNAGVGDTTTRDAVARLDRDVRSHHPDLVVVQFGINDSWIDADQGKRAPRLTRSEFRANLRYILDTLQGDGAQLVLMTPNPMRWSDPFYIKVFTEKPGLLDTHEARGIDRWLDLYAQDVRDVARTEHVTLVDVFQAFEDYGARPGNNINDILLAGDGIHPNQAGQDLVCALLAPRLAEMVSHRARPPAR
jgi:lysophospholipase L1-like esterase